jgi:hypothetical protein
MSDRFGVCIGQCMSNLLRQVVPGTLVGLLKNLELATHIVCMLTCEAGKPAIALAFNPMTGTAPSDARFGQALAKDQFTARIRRVGISFHGALT